MITRTCSARWLSAMVTAAWVLGPWTGTTGLASSVQSQPEAALANDGVQAETVAKRKRPDRKKKRKRRRRRAEPEQEQQQTEQEQPTESQVEDVARPNESPPEPAAPAPPPPPPPPPPTPPPPTAPPPQAPAPEANVNAGPSGPATQQSQPAAPTSPPPPPGTQTFMGPTTGDATSAQPTDTHPAAAATPAAPKEETVKTGVPQGPKPSSAPKRYTRYDHLCITYTISSLGEMLASASDNGWEMTSLSKLDGEQIACFKRPTASATLANE